jgi:hypothetical protein
MDKLTEINIDWIGICNMMQILQKQRKEVYDRWYEQMKLEGYDIQYGQIFCPSTEVSSFYHDLNGNDITI